MFKFQKNCILSLQHIQHFILNEIFISCNKWKTLQAKTQAIRILCLKVVRHKIFHYRQQTTKLILKSAYFLKQVLFFHFFPTVITLDNPLSTKFMYTYYANIMQLCNIMHIIFLHSAVLNKWSLFKFLGRQLFSVMSNKCFTCTKAQKFII